MKHFMISRKNREYICEIDIWEQNILREINCQEVN